LEVVQEVFMVAIYFLAQLWQEDARIFRTQVGKYDYGRIWEEMFGVIEVW
jgi:hypothetical protein